MTRTSIVHSATFPAWGYEEGHSLLLTVYEWYRGRGIGVWTDQWEARALSAAKDFQCEGRMWSWLRRHKGQKKLRRVHVGGSLITARISPWKSGSVKRVLLSNAFVHAGSRCSMTDIRWANEQATWLHALRQSSNRIKGNWRTTYSWSSIIFWYRWIGHRPRREN